MIDIDYLRRLGKDSVELSPRARFALLSHCDKLTLHHIAQNLPGDAVILEVGTFLGSSAAIMSHANPTATIYTLDAYDPAWQVSVKDEARDEMMARALGADVPWTLDTVRESIKDKYPNIKFFKGVSPGDFEAWDIEIDLYHEDGDHTAPAVRDNLHFWTNKVKRGGFVVCHDYRPHLAEDDPMRCYAVESAIDELISSGRVVFLTSVGQFAILQRQ